MEFDPIKIPYKIVSRFSVILYFNVHLISFTKMEMVPKECSRWQVLYLKNIS